MVKGLIEGLDDLDGFECVADPTRGAMDQQKVERGIVARVTAILRRTPVRAILCECTELPAFSDALRTATSLPVFDVVTCLDFFHSARNRSFHSAVRHHAGHATALRRRPLRQPRQLQGQRRRRWRRDVQEHGRARQRHPDCSAQPGAKPSRQ